MSNIPPQEEFYPSGEDHPPTSVVGDIFLKEGQKIDCIHQQHRACFPKRFYLEKRCDTKQ